MKHLLEWLPAGLRSLNGGLNGGLQGGKQGNTVKSAAATTTATARVAVTRQMPVPVLGVRRRGSVTADARQLSFAFDDAPPSPRPQDPGQGPVRSTALEQEKAPSR